MGPKEEYLLQLQYGGEGSQSPLEEATPEPHDTYTWWLLCDSPEARTGVPLFPDLEAAGPHYTLGPQNPVGTGRVLAAPALPPAGRHRHSPLSQVP